MPMHKGHLRCLQMASELCEHVWLVLVVGGKDEIRIHREDTRDFLSVDNRWEQMVRAASMFDNVQPVMIDVSSCCYPDGEEDWDMETPIMLQATGYFTAVFGSEPGYQYYFNRAYPWAEYVLVDPGREETPISATAIRNMESEEEMKEWII